MNNPLHRRCQRRQDEVAQQLQVINAELASARRHLREAREDYVFYRDRNNTLQDQVMDKVPVWMLTPMLGLGLLMGMLIGATAW